MIRLSEICGDAGRVKGMLSSKKQYSFDIVSVGAIHSFGAAMLETSIKPTAIPHSVTDFCKLCAPSDDALSLSSYVCCMKLIEIVIFSC